ncbi:pentatricopeptide repeat-containing protein At5g15280, mitochondrial-like [Neltuma alba]|uniref:pentatricopeptide repeat-containing protein At5g15280, mitochondrial-like n=1 Tax=Neltuma alba TaxID=207710 RepID=UPI0010A402CC|nr:pentatricopeptide repeat-containing protein At5g15280, mitochondrial-like [Prosopis alba]
MWKHARGILDEMMDRGTIPDMSTFRVLLAGYCKARKFEEAKGLVSEMKSRSLIELSWSEDPLSKAFLILGLNPLTVRLKRDNDVRLSETEFFDDIGNGLYLDTDLDQYENHVNGVLEDSNVPNFNSFIREECINGNLKSALLLVEEMLRWGQELLLPDFSELVRRLCSSRSQIKSMTHLLEKMPQLACKLDQETLNLVVQAYCKKGLLSNAKFILEEMLQRKLRVKNETYTALLMSLCKKGNMRDFHNYWDVAQKDSWLPAFYVFEDLLTYICHQKMIGKALQLLEIMLLSYPHQRSGICYAFLEVVCATGFSGFALGFLEQLRPWFVLDHAGYNHLIRGLFKEGKFDVAFSILNGMLDKNLAPCLDVSVLLIDQLCKAGLHDKAIALKDIILKEHSAFSTSSHCALIHGFYNSGNTEKADTLFQDILSKGLILDSEVCNILIQASFKANDLRKVGEILGFTIRKNLVTLSSYRSLVRMMCVTGRVPDALSLKNLMLEQGTSDGLVLYNILIFYLLSSRNNSLVNKILDEMDEKKVVPNEVTYNFLVYGFLHCKDTFRSLHYLTTMIEKELKPSSRSMRFVISSLCNIGELQKALEFSQEMESRGWSHGSVIQNAITEGLLSHGKIQEAENFVDRMQEGLLTPENINYDNLVKQFCQHGRLDKAVHLMNIMLKKHNVPTSSSYDSVICGFCAQNKLDRALDLYSEMFVHDLKPKIKTQEMLFHCFCQHGRTEEAERFLMDMIENGETPTREMFCSAINTLRMEKNLKKASEMMQAMQQVGYDPDFETHWSLISNLSDDKAKHTDNRSKRFLSRLLSESGFSLKRRFRT